jgi:hypothetical protein
MSTLHSRDSLAARDYIGCGGLLGLVGRKLARGAAVVECGFYPCGACTIHFDDGAFPLIRGPSRNIIKAARGLLSCSPGEAPHPCIPPALRSRHRARYPRPRTVDCRRFRTTGRHGDDRGKAAREASRARDRASRPC